MDDSMMTSGSMRSARFAKTVEFQHLAMQRELGSGRGLLQKKVNPRIFKLLASAAFLAQQQHGAMGMTNVLTASKNIPALDLVQETVLQEKSQSAVDCRGRNLLALGLGELIDDGVSAKRAGALAENRQYATAKRSQL
jgi:hypothetical protein